MVDAFASERSDNGNAESCSVWFYLAFDLAGSRWNTHTDL